MVEALEVVGDRMKQCGVQPLYIQRALLSGLVEAVDDAAEVYGMPLISD